MFDYLKIYLLNAGVLSIISLAKLETYFTVILLAATAGYTISRAYGQILDNKLKRRELKKQEEKDGDESNR